ncbi:MAG: hypothetical protein IIA90_02250, partial [Chloroflexi bacterium]|nr:hypothetical protein [Chloroflexota bacterium]
MGTESDALEKTLKGIFRDVSQPDEDDLSDQMHYVPGVASLLPLPYMVFFALVIGAECRYSYRPEEKVAWSVRLRFKGEEMRVEHGKFGMRIASSAESPELAEEFIATVSRAFPVMDRILGPVVDERVRLGSV